MKRRGHTNRLQLTNIQIMSASPDLSRPRDSGAAIAIPSPTTLLEVRVGKLRPFGPVLSAIVKDARSDALFVSRLGFVDDEHDPTFHGGLEKAIHQYNADHYASWRKLFPAAETSERFVPGSFGENLVTRGWSEDNICAGDIVKVGYFDAQHPAGLAPSGCVLQVSLPRTPCFKLNQRFHLKNFAPRTHELNRTGWYYRVIQEGWVEPGMQMQITSRPNPAWSIKRLNHYVHREKENLYAITTLRALPHLGDECAEVFRDRWAKLQQKEKLAKETWRPFRLSLKQRQTPRITAFTFEALEPDATSTEADGGSHVSIKLPNGLKRAYSVISGTTDCFQLGVARDDNSRGGSAYMHDSLQVGDTITAGPVTASIQYNSMASHNILIAGGIGITAFPALIRDLTAVNITSELHYCKSALPPSLHETPASPMLTIRSRCEIERGGRFQRCPCCAQRQSQDRHLRCRQG